MYAFRNESPVPVELATTTFGPLGKYVAANDNNPQPLDESGASAGFGVGRPGDWMQTYSARQFWPMDPRPDEIHIEDIAHSLALQCRYAGHCIRFYSVAEHSVHIALWLLRQYGPTMAMHGLLHDASEAYLVDVPRPVKPFLPGYKEAEARVMAAVSKRFGLVGVMPPEVKEADDRIIADEVRANMRPMAWHAKWDDPLGVKIGCWSPEAAEDEFLSTYVMLEQKLGRVA